MLKLTKKGKGVMMFIDLQSNVSEEQADVATRIWQTGLQNNHIIVERWGVVEILRTDILRVSQDGELVKKMFIMITMQISN